MQLVMFVWHLITQPIMRLEVFGNILISSIYTVTAGGAKTPQKWPVRDRISKWHYNQGLLLSEEQITRNINDLIS